MADAATARHNFLVFSGLADDILVTFDTRSRFRQTMLDLDSLGSPNCKQDLVAWGVTAIGYVVHLSLHVSLADYGK